MEGGSGSLSLPALTTAVVHGSIVVVVDRCVVVSISSCFMREERFKRKKICEIHITTFCYSPHRNSWVTWYHSVAIHCVKVTVRVTFVTKED